MRRTSRDTPLAPESDMVDSSSTRGTGYRPVPSNEGHASLTRTSPPVYGTIKQSRSRASTLLLAGFALVVSLFLVAALSNMPITQRLRAALFNANPPDGVAPTSALSPSAVTSLNSFGLRLFARLAGAPEEQNVVISPASVASSLTMVAAGATQSSQNAKELEGLLGAGFASPAGRSDPTVTLDVANAAWVSGSVHESFKADMKKALAADVFPAPKDISEVNNWVSKATRGNIKTIMDSVPSPLVALLVNAVYFKASWTMSFDPRDTIDAPFYGPKGSQGGDKVATVRMMRHLKEYFRYAEHSVPGRTGQTVKMVELLYGKKDEYAATIAVPTGQMTLAELSDLFKDGDTKLWDEWVGRLTSKKLEVLAMPRFKVEYGVQSLKETLQQIGINAAFSSNRDNPQFLKMSSDKDTYLDDVLHKATLECTEEGTVASAATASVMMSRSMPRPMPSVVLDRPFLFSIRNRVSGAILFIARVDKPVSP